MKLIDRSVSPEASSEALVAMDKYLRLALRKKDLRQGTNEVRVVLEAKAAKWSDLPRDALTSLSEIDAFDIAVGKTPRPTIRIRANTGAGLTFGVYEFLERYLGIMWLFPGPLGLHVPEAEHFDVPVGTVRSAPQFISRIFTGVPPGVYPDWGKAMRLRNLVYASHNMIAIFPVEESKRLHPEIFPIKDGKRHIPDPKRRQIGHAEHWHPCYSNPKTVEVATAKAKAYFEKAQGLTFSLGINDGTRLQCACATCKKVGWPNAYYEFVKKVAENVKEHYPPFMIGVLSYGDVWSRPDDLVLPENVIVLEGDVVRWKGIAQHLATYEYLYGNGFWFPMFPLKGLKSNALLHRKLGVKGLHAEAHPVWAFDGPKLYIRARLLWDADFDVDAGLERYCKAAFGKGWKPMLDFYRYWAARKDRDLNPKGHTPTLDMTYFRQSNATFAALSETDYAVSERCLKQAAARVTRDLPRKRIEMVAAFMAYSRNAFDVWRLRPRALDAEARDGHALLMQALALKRKRDKLLIDMRSHREWFHGTNVTVAHILGPKWEGRPTWTLNYELDAAIRTLLHTAPRSGAHVKLNIPEDFRVCSLPATTRAIHLAKFNAWLRYYHNHLYDQMLITPEGDIVRFKLRADAPRKIQADTPHAYLAPNGLRRHWFRGRTPLDQGKHYLFGFDIRARKGMADIRVHNENDAGTMVWLQETFGDAVERRRKRMLLKPVEAWGDSARRVGAWEVEVMFTPDAEDADVQGTCAVHEVTFQAAADR